MTDKTTLEEVQTILDTMPAAMSAKGKREPEATFYQHGNASPGLYLSWRDPNKIGYDRVSHAPRGETFAELAKSAQEWIAALPSAEEAKLQDFMNGLGKLIDQGKDSGIDLEYLNPLHDAMKRISENVITYRPDKIETREI